MSLVVKNIFYTSEQNKNILQDNDFVMFTNKLKEITLKYGYSESNKVYNKLKTRIQTLEEEYQKQIKEYNQLKNKFEKIRKETQNISLKIEKQKSKLKRILETK